MNPNIWCGSCPNASDRFSDVEIVRLLTLETIPLTLMASKARGHCLNIRSFYTGSAKSKVLAQNIRFITPMNLSAVPRLFISRRLPIHVALIQVCPPDDFGWMSLGISVDVTLAAAQAADLVIAQVNPRMPRVLGRSFIHVNDVDMIVVHEEELLTVDSYPEQDSALMIARHIPRLVDDGATLQIGLGATSQATLEALSNKNDLGIHTQYLTDDIMQLFSKGVITNRKKGFNDGKLVASGAIGSRNLYDFLDDNPGIEFHPSDVVNDPGVICRHNRMVSMNVAMAIDLTGQVAADASRYNHFSGAIGLLDFVRGAAQAPGGKPVILLPSTASGGKKSRIVPTLDDTAVVVPRGDVQYVVTEYGSANLFGKNIQERAMALISIAHPDFREELFFRAQKMQMLGPERTLKESLSGIYPVNLEVSFTLDGQDITIRPAKRWTNAASRSIFTPLPRTMSLPRFFHEKTRFNRDEISSVSQVDYVNNLTIVALVGEFGFGQVVGLGEYLLDTDKNMAEVAFSISRGWQNKGIGGRILNKLAEAARSRGIGGFYAITAPGNRRMIKLFNRLAYKVETDFEDDMLFLSCRFDQPNT